MSTPRKLLWVVIGVTAVVVLAIALWPRSTPSLAQRTRSLATEFRCVDCEGLSVAESSTESARIARRDIRTRLRRGESTDSIRQSYVDRYGESVLLKPAGGGVSAIVWALPIGLLVLGAGGLFLALRRWQRQPRLEATDADEAFVAAHRHPDGETEGRPADA
jgi:cytochrome c-type biogenesis protein CcmH